MESKELLLKYELPTQEELTQELGHIDFEEKGLILTLIEKINEKSRSRYF